MKDDWGRIERARERDAEKLARTTRLAASEDPRTRGPGSERENNLRDADSPYVLPDATAHTVTCEECGGQVVYVRDEYTCEECGLVQT